MTAAEPQPIPVQNIPGVGEIRLIAYYDYPNSCWRVEVSSETGWSEDELYLAWSLIKDAARREVQRMRRVRGIPLTVGRFELTADECPAYFAARGTTQRDNRLFQVHLQQIQS